MVCIASLRSALDTQPDPLSKNNKNEKGRGEVERREGGEERGKATNYRENN